MAIYIKDQEGNRTLVAGGGAAGKSAYDYAVDGGYTGTEEEFQALMGSGPWLPTSGGTITGDIVINKDKRIIFANDPSDPGTERKIMVAAYSAWNPNEYGGYPVLSIGGRFGIGDELVNLRGIATPQRGHDAANKDYVDAQIGDIASILDAINREVV